jgi:hypothetical protein
MPTQVQETLTDFEGDEVTQTYQSQSGVQSVVEAYLAGSHDKLPIGGYAAMMSLFIGSFATFVFAASRSRVLPRRVDFRDVVLLGLATHKLTRIVSRERVTIPLRVPFTKYEGSNGAGQVQERPRGRGLRRAIGSLLVCQYCVGPWVASMFTAGLVYAPRATRLVSSVFAMVTISDFLHQGYAGVRQLSK